MQTQFETEQANQILTAEGEKQVSSAHRQELTIADARLQKMQKMFGYGVILIPLLGTLTALVLAFYVGISQTAIILLIVMYALTMVGLTVGYHRLFAHNAFQTNKTVQIVFAILGSMAAQGHLVHWISNHRRHHQLGDRPGDPHSPHYRQNGQKLTTLGGFYHAHVSWLFESDFPNVLLAKDWLKDKVIMKVNRLYLVWVVVGIAIPGMIAGLITQTWLGVLEGVLWGGFVRIFLVYNAMSSINSIAHLYGSRSFETTEHSRNNFWLAIPTSGEAWHNNHHAFSNSAVFGLKWWQIDPGAWTIRILEKAGLVWEVKKPSINAIATKKALKVQPKKPKHTYI